MSAALILPQETQAQEATLPVTEAHLDLPETPQRSLAHRVVEAARSLRGIPYVWGAEDPDRGFDCSGFLQYVFRSFGVNLPRTSVEQARVGSPLPLDMDILRPGDLLTFGHRGRVSHIGMYIGGGRYVHASSSQGVTETKLLQRPGSGYKPWIGARRLALEESARLLGVEAESYQ